MTIDRSEVTWNFGVEFGRGGSQALMLDLAMPLGGDSSPRSAVIFVHGGGWNSGSRRGGHSVMQRLAQSGFVAVSIDYRLSAEAKFPAQLEDCRAAVRYLRQHAHIYGVDPERIGIMGYSAGGHLAALVGLAAENDGAGGFSESDSRVAAVADVSGPSDLEALLLSPPTGEVVRQLMGENQNADLDAVRLASPRYNVHPGAPPFYIAHGTDDDLVPIGQSEELARALVVTGNAVTLRPILGYGHVTVDSLPGVIIQEIVNFFLTHLSKHEPSVPHQWRSI